MTEEQEQPQSDEEPKTESRLFGLGNVVVTPHLGASTAEATDRAGFQAAEQIVAALNGGTVTSAVNAPALRPEDIASAFARANGCRVGRCAA